MLTIEQIHTCLKNHQPQTLALETRRHAAVAILLTEADQRPEVLFIRRAEYAGDPWSGDVAFPGGGIEPQDEGAQQAAERETWEEIGLQLAPQQCLGQLDDLAGAYLPIRISSFVYRLAEKPQLKFNGEVVDSFWVPLETLQSCDRNQEQTFTYRGNTRSHPTVDLSGFCEHYLWGISYRILQQLFSLIANR